VTANPNIAQHLAELDAQYDAHLFALRERAVQASDAIADTAAELGGRLEPELQNHQNS
jgi:hypothetical protein